MERNTALVEALHALIHLHKSIGGVWSIEVRNGHGFYQEVILAAYTAEDCERLAAELGIKLGRETSIRGDAWWSEGSTVVDGISIRVTGPHFQCHCEVQP